MAKPLKAKWDLAAAQEAIDSETLIELEDHFYSSIDCDHIRRFSSMSVRS